MSKKAIMWILGLVLVILVFLLIFFLFFRKDTPAERGAFERSDLFNPFGEGFPVQTFEQDSEFDSQFQFPGISKLKQITTVPVSGFDIFYREVLDDADVAGGADINTEIVRSNIESLTQEEFETIFRYTERATGHVYETTFDDEVNKRISNVTIPRNQKSIFLNDGEQIIYRFVPENDPSMIRTYFSEFTYNSSSQEESEMFTAANTDGFFLMNNITHIIKSAGNQLFGLVSRKAGTDFNSVGFLIDPSNMTNVDVILESEISEWRPQWVGEDTVALTTSPNYNTGGYSFKLNVNSGNLRRILGPVSGLVTNYSPNGKYVLLSISNEEKTESYIYNLDSLELTRTFLTTLADKCVWSIDSVSVFCGSQVSVPAESPDAWYKGLFHFDDTLISHNMNDLGFRIYNEFNPNTTPALDITNLKLSDNKEFVIFQNKRDLTLWAYDLR